MIPRAEGPYHSKFLSSLNDRISGGARGAGIRPYGQYRGKRRSVRLLKDSRAVLTVWAAGSVCALS